MKTRINITILTTFLVFLFISCTQSNNVITITKFPKVEELYHEKILTSPNLYTPVGLLLLDSAIVTLDLKSDTLFQVFKLPSFTHIGGFIRRGEGPDEEFFVDPFMQRLANNQFMFRNLTGIKTVKYNPSTDSIQTTRTIKLTNGLIDLFHTFIIDHQIIGVKADKATPKEFVSYNPETQAINDFGEDYPVIKKNIQITDKDKIQLFAKANTVKPDGTAFACVYDKFPILRIYSHTGELKKDIRWIITNLSLTL